MSDIGIYHQLALRGDLIRGLRIAPKGGLSLLTSPLPKFVLVGAFAMLPASQQANRD
jgi:hypothetical protein